MRYIQDPVTHKLIPADQYQRPTQDCTIIRDLKPYIDPNLGDQPVYVKSKKHRRELMKKAKVYERFGKGWV